MPCKAFGLYLVGSIMYVFFQKKSFNKYLLSICYVPGSVLNTGSTDVRKTQILVVKAFVFMGKDSDKSSRPSAEF